MTSAPGRVVARRGHGDPLVRGRVRSGTLVYATGGHAGAGKERLEVFAGGATFVLDDFRELSAFGVPMKPLPDARSRQGTVGPARELRRGSAWRGGSGRHGRGRLLGHVVRGEGYGSVVRRPPGARTYAPDLRDSDRSHSQSGSVSASSRHGRSRPGAAGDYAVLLASVALVVQLGNFGLSSSLSYYVSRRPRRAGTRGSRSVASRRRPARRSRRRDVRGRVAGC